MRMIDETGNRYGSLTVIKYAKDHNGRGAWLCQCDCGNFKIVRGPDLRKNKITHCSPGCPYKTAHNFIDETGNRYGFLTVLYKTPTKSSSNKTLWHCKCDCGRECDIIGEQLRSGKTKSCGCQSDSLNAQAHSKDLSNQIFGYLEPIEIVGQSKEGNIWRCKCNCGCQREDVLVASHRLLSGNTASCGRLKRSHGELEIENYLKNHNITFLSEYSFEDLINPISKKKLRFDFAIFKNNNLLALIEFDGEQHFTSVDFFGGEEEFKSRKTNDNLKNTYCKKNNLLLFRISYNEDIKIKMNQIIKELYLGDEVE